MNLKYRHLIAIAIACLAIAIGSVEAFRFRDLAGLHRSKSSSSVFSARTGGSPSIAAERNFRLGKAVRTLLASGIRTLARRAKLHSELLTKQDKVATATAVAAAAPSLSEAAASGSSSAITADAAAAAAAAAAVDLRPNPVQVPPVNFLDEAANTVVVDLETRSGPEAKKSEAAAAASGQPSQYVDVSTLTDNDKIMGLAPKASTSSSSSKSLPECATQQVCNALFVRRNLTQNLCECSTGNGGWTCSSEPNAQDGHTVELTRRYDKKVYTQIKTCEPLVSVRQCKNPTDWTLLALQSERTGKAHYVVVCKCPEWAKLEGPYTHSHPPYARVPGIRVYGMLCAQSSRKNRMGRGSGGGGGLDDGVFAGDLSLTSRSRHSSSGSTSSKVDNKRTSSLFYSADIHPEFPWEQAFAVINSTMGQNLW